MVNITIQTITRRVITVEEPSGLGYCGKFDLKVVKVKRYVKEEFDKPEEEWEKDTGEVCSCSLFRASFARKYCRII